MSLALCQNESSAKPSLWKCISHTGSFPCKLTNFHMKGSSRRLVLKVRHKVFRKWPINQRSAANFHLSFFSIPSGYLQQISKNLSLILIKALIVYEIHRKLNYRKIWQKCESGFSDVELVLITIGFPSIVRKTTTRAQGTVSCIWEFWNTSEIL